MIDPDVFFSMDDPINANCHIIHSKQGFRNPDGPYNENEPPQLYGWDYKQWVTDNINTVFSPEFRCNYVYIRCTNPLCAFKGSDGGPGPDIITTQWIKWGENIWFNSPPRSCIEINSTSICGTSMLEHVYVVPKAFTSIQIKTYTGDPDIHDSINYDDNLGHPSQKFSLTNVYIPGKYHDPLIPNQDPDTMALIDGNYFRQACLVRYLREAAP